MRTIAIDDPVAWVSISLSIVCQSRGFTVQTDLSFFGEPSNIALDRTPNFPHGIDAAFAKLLWPVVRLHRMHEMQTIVTDDRGVCLSHGSTRLHCAKTVEQIKILFGVNILKGPRNIMLDGGPDPPHRVGRGVG